jgi:hypothetical protein
MSDFLSNGHAWPYLTYNPDDELDGIWTREQLVEMDARFVAALEEAFRSGQQHRNSAGAEIGGISNGSPALARQRAREFTGFRMLKAAAAAPLASVEA